MDLQLHRAQMGILLHLLLNQKATFSEISKPLKLSSDHFNYHLSCLVKSGYVEKNDDHYVLTIQGVEFANRMDTDRSIIEKQGKLSCIVMVEKYKGQKKYLLVQRRTKEPYFGYLGPISGKISWGEKVLETAARELAEETGLKADLEFQFLIHELVYLKSDGRLLEDKYFYIVNGKNPTGDLINTQVGENNWVLKEDFLKEDKVYYDEFELLAMVERGEKGFIEKEYFIEEF